MAGGYFEEIEQDSDKIRDVVDSIFTLKKQFDEEIDNFYKKLHESINLNKSDTTVWYGPKASNFAASVDAKKTSFDNASTTIQSEINTLSEHADEWDELESR